MTKTLPPFKSALGLATMLALCVCGTLAQARTFRSADVHAKDYPTNKAVVYMGEELKKSSNGKDSVKVFSDSALGSEKDTIEQVKIGALDMVRSNVSAFHGIVPASQIPSLPFIFRDVNHFRSTMNGPTGDKILASFEKAGFIGLAFYESGARSIYSKKPIKNVSDMKGLKIRVQPSDLSVSFISVLGASPTPMPYAEVYTGMKTGLIDGAENNLPSYEESKHFETANVFSETQHMMSPEVLVFSKKIWDTLAPQEQASLRDAAKKSVPYYTQLWEAKEKSSKEALVKAGVKFVPASEIDHKGFVAVEKPVWDKFATTPELKALVQEVVNAK